MVAKQTGQVAGGFAGGFFNNPGVVAAIGIVAAIGLTLFFFQNDIRKFFSGISEGFGQITLPTIELPDITFPTFEFPDITFPSFPDITFPSFPDINISIPGFPGVPDPFVDPERMDVPLPGGGSVDIVPGFGRDDPRRPTPEPGEPEFIGPTIEELFPNQPVNIMDFINRFRDRPIRAEIEARLEPFAVANVSETQAEFQERSGAFAEMFADITRSTSLPGGDIIFGRQLARESEDFESVLETEASRSESIFAALFGNVQNPEFGA